ncbi:MAG: hypothetical protein N3F67_03070 [Acidilobaceae archaeon]|nr:hypothetical protein [Acidilobaceae archaeon]
MKRVKAESLAEELAQRFHEHHELMEEVKRVLSLARAGGAVSFEEPLELLRLNRGSILSDLGLYEGDKSDDLFALVGYYFEVASVNERELLMELSEFVDVSRDLQELEVVRQRAWEVLERLQ